MLNEFITGLSDKDIFRSAQNGHVTPLQLNMKMSMDGTSTMSQKRPLQIKEKEFPGLKDIHQTPKQITQPILTQKGKFILIVITLVTAAYFIYQSYKSNQIQSQAPPASPQQPTDPSSPIPEPPKPPAQAIDNSPSAAEI